MIIKNKGFTLLETILVVGIITLLITTVYNIAVKRNQSYLVEKQAEFVTQIIKSLDDYLLTTGNIAEINGLVSPPINLIEQRIIPEAMANSSNTIVTLWGSPATITGIDLDITPSDPLQGPVPGYEINLTAIPSTVCSKLASHPLIIKSSQRIMVNGITVKSPGVSEPDSALIASSCINANNNIQIASNAFRNGIDPIGNSNASGHLRNKETKYNIAPTGQAISSISNTCTGGASWDATVSACTCPATAKWNGTACVIFSTVANPTGVCNIGQFFNPISKACQALYPIGQKYNPVTNTAVAAPNSIRTLCIPGVNTSNPNTPASSACVTVNNQESASPVYDGGRHIPNTVVAPVAPAFSSIATNTTHTAQINTSMPSTNALAGTIACPVGSIPTLAVNSTNPNPNFDGKNCQMCVNGTWDGDRCVTN